MRKIKLSTAKSARPAPASGLEHGELLGQKLSTAVIAFHEAVAARLGISANEWKCLGLLHQLGPSTAGRLAELSGLSTGAITGIVDRLEAAGFARRQPNPEDRRGVIIHPLRTDELRAEVTPIFASLSRAMAALSSRYTARELAAIQDYFERTVQVLHDETVKLSERDEKIL